MVNLARLFPAEHHTHLRKMSVLRAVLTQRTEHNAILQGQSSQLERSEKLGDILLALRKQGSARWWILLRSEVRDSRRWLVNEDLSAFVWLVDDVVV